MNNLPSVPSVLDLLDEVYRAALEPERWPTALTQFARISGGLGVNVYAIEPETEAIVQGLAAGVDEQAISEYVAHMHELCPRLAAWRRNPRTPLFYDHEFTSEHEIRRSEYYNWLEKAAGLKYFIASGFEVAPSVEGVVTIQRSRRQGHVDSTEIELFRRLVPHVQRALRMSYQLQYRSLDSQILENLVEALPQAVFVLDQRGLILTCNRVGERLLRDDDGVHEREGHLRGTHSSADRRLLAAIDNASQYQRRVLVDPLGVFGIARFGRNHPLYVLVAPLVRERAVLDLRLPAVVVFAYDPEQGHEKPTTVLRRLFKLAPREAELAVLLVSGLNLAHACEQLQVTINTGRTYLKQILRKTGCSKQSDLVRLLLSLPSWNN